MMTASRDHNMYKVGSPCCIYIMRDAQYYSSFLFIFSSGEICRCALPRYEESKTATIMGRCSPIDSGLSQSSLTACNPQWPRAETIGVSNIFMPGRSMCGQSHYVPFIFGVISLMVVSAHAVLSAMFICSMQCVCISLHTM